jgi:putative endonuclease
VSSFRKFVEFRFFEDLFMAEHNDKGLEGEELAAVFLTQNGYSILEKNWRFGKEEIDIIAQKDDTLIVVEVKTRSGSFFGEPEEFVNRQKQKHLIKAVNAYIEKNELDLEVRFDIVGIVITGKNHRVNHIEDAFNPIA